MIPILVAVIPGLIKLAEGVFSGSGRGSTKKDFVMRVVEALLQNVNLPDVLKNTDEKKMMLEIISVVIDNLVPELTK